MPYTATDHQETKIVELSSFVGGINSNVPPTQIADNECTMIQNMFMDRTSGRLRTRYPIIRYSSTAAPNILYGIHYWKGVWILATTDQKVFYLDGSKNPQPLGGLNGTSRPCFCPFNNKLIIASGGILQQISISGTTPQAIENVTSAPKASYVFQKYGRLVTSGDSDNVDRLQESGYFTDSTWGATDYGDVGYLDDTSVVGMTEAFEGTYIIFKRGYGGLKTYYTTTLSNSAPTHMLAADGHAVRAHAGIVHALGRILVLEEHFVSALVGTDAYGKVLYDQTPGAKLSSSLDANADCFGVQYPRDAQAWFVPQPGSGRAYIYHYLLNAWTTFDFGSRKIYSAFYDPVGDYLYLGCEDGYVYKYDYTSAAYADTAGAYTSRFATKMFAQGNREMVLKSPRLVWTSLATGSGTMKVKTDYGQTTTTWGTITVSQPQDYVADSSTVDVADLTAYTEVDVPGRLTVTSTSIAVNDCGQNEDVYVYKDFGAGYFSSDFEVRGTLNYASTSVTGGSTGIFYTMSFSNALPIVPGTTQTIYVGVVVLFDMYLTLSLVDLGGTTVSYATASVLLPDTSYSMRVVRSATGGANGYGSVAAYLHNSTTGAYVAHVALSSTAAVSYRYFVPFSSYNNGSSGRAMDLTLSNVSIVNDVSTGYVYDTRLGGTYESYVWPENVYGETKADYNQPTESFQFDTTLTSGGFMIERLVAEVSASRRV